MGSFRRGKSDGSCYFKYSLDDFGRGLSIVIQAFISPTNAQQICLKILKFTLKYTINAPTYFGLTKPPSGSLQSVLR